MSTSLVNNDPVDSIFSQQFYANKSENSDEVPWWQKNFFLQPSRFVNAWNGVFPTVIVNIFGIVIFLRMGWIVGTAGVFQSLIIVILCTLFSMVTVLSAIGICERCQVKQGGIYFLISHVLGKRIGSSIGIIYTFGQAIATSLVALGFGESIARLIFGSFNQITAKFFGALVLVILNALNFAGLRFIIKLQLLLMSFLGIAVLDFFLGALFTQNLEHGINYLSRKRLLENWDSHYETKNCTYFLIKTIKVEEYNSFEYKSTISGTITTFLDKNGIDGILKTENFFSVFGVLFANFIGVLAGVNMGTNLQNPLKDFAKGELSALATSFGLCFLFVLALGSGVERQALICDFMISERVSLTKIFFMFGLYISCLCSILSSTLGTSRVLQGIASEGLVPILNLLAEEENTTSSDKNPLKATILVTVVSILFLFVGNLNKLAILSAMPFLVTYAFVNYAYVSLAMSTDLNIINEEDRSKTSYGSLQNVKNDSTSKNENLPQNYNNLFESKQLEDEGSVPNAAQLSNDGSKPWYSKCVNRYVSFISAIVHILIIIFINKWFALFFLIAFVLLYVNIGQKTSPSFEQGVSQFSIIHMIQVALNYNKLNSTLSSSSSATTKNLAVIHTPNNPSFVDTVKFETSQLNDKNNDYLSRNYNYHAEQVNNLE